jgi:Family of unknown function (DUF6152)
MENCARPRSSNPVSSKPWRGVCYAVACAAAVAVLTGIAARSAAHHAFAAEFDADRPVVLRGKITKIEWINPHSWIHIAVADKDGVLQKWMVEGGTPNTLIRNGLTRDSLKVGTEIIVRGYQSKDEFCEPACKANGRDITFTDGRKIFMGSSGTGAPKDGSDPVEKK